MTSQDIAESATSRQRGEQHRGELPILGREQEMTEVKRIPILEMCPHWMIPPLVTAVTFGFPFSFCLGDKDHQNQ